MRKFLLLLVLIAAALWVLSQRFVLQSGHAPNGVYNLLLVDTKTGAIHKVLGK